MIGDVLHSPSLYVGFVLEHKKQTVYIDLLPADCAGKYEGFFLPNQEASIHMTKPAG